MCTEIRVQKIQDFPPSENNQSVLHDGRAGAEVPFFTSSWSCDTGKLFNFIVPQASYW